MITQSYCRGEPYSSDLINRRLKFGRKDGHERQYRFLCPRCSLPIGYQTNPPPAKSAPYIYILSGALTLLQGQVPPDAFDGEDDDDA